MAIVFFIHPILPLFHYYVNPSNVIKRPFHWDQTENIDSPTNWHDLKQIGRQRLDLIVEGKINPPYGVGNDKTFKDYADFSGLNIPRKEVLDPNNALCF